MRIDFIMEYYRHKTIDIKHKLTENIRKNKSLVGLYYENYCNYEQKSIILNFNVLIKDGKRK